MRTFRDNEVITLTNDDDIYFHDLGNFGVVVNGGLGFDVATVLEPYYPEPTWFSHTFVRGSTTFIQTDFFSVQLNDFERVNMANGTLALDTEGNAGQVYRLYKAALDRAPDNDGLKYWIGRLDEGNTTLIDIADSFLNSPEFVDTYGTEQTVSNEKFVDLLYTHTLGRDYDLEGYNYWVEKLDEGTTNRRDLVAQFSESDENKANVADAISDGIWLY